MERGELLHGRELAHDTVVDHGCLMEFRTAVHDAVSNRLQSWQFPERLEKLEDALDGLDVIGDRFAPLVDGSRGVNEAEHRAVIRPGDLALERLVSAPGEPAFHNANFRDALPQLIASTCIDIGTRETPEVA